jgi:glycosyltransferase involved in cell wall biosynthesis
MTNKKKVALLTNIVAPARLPVYAGLAEHFDLLILHGAMEHNRDGWDDAGESLSNARIVRAWGWQLEIPRREKGRAFDRRYVHIEPGYLHHLISFRPNAVITGEMGLRTAIALAYGAFFRKPVWVWWGGTLHTERHTGLLRRLARSVIRRWARRWISYGQSSTEYLQSLGVAVDRILQIQNSVDERLFSPDGPRSFDISPKPVLLHVGQFIMRKGIETLLGAAAALQHEGLEFSLVLVGSGPDKQQLQHLSGTLGLNNVHFLPPRPAAEMPSVYRSADILVFPTLEDVWGLVANEAMLCGLPVLCSRYAGCADELFPPENIFDPGDAQEFHVKLREAVSGRLARPDVSRLKTTPHILNQLISALDRSANPPLPVPTNSSREELFEP